MRGLLLRPDGDAEVVEGDWASPFAIGELIEAEYVQAELLQRSCSTCPDLAIWVNGDPDVTNETAVVNMAASRMANLVVLGKALIIGLADRGVAWEYADLDPDELLRLAARVVLAEHNIQLKEGQSE